MAEEWTAYDRRLWQAGMDGTRTEALHIRCRVLLSAVVDLAHTDMATGL